MFHVAAALEVATCAGAGISAFYYSWLNSRSSRGVSITPRIEPPELCGLRSRYGYNEHSLIGSSIDSEVWVSVDKRGAIAYTESGGIWMVARRAFCRRYRPGPHYQRIHRPCPRVKENCRVPSSHGTFCTARSPPMIFGSSRSAHRHILISPTWNPRGNSAKHLRTGVNRGRRAGLSVTEVTELTPAFRVRC